jgi:hypothetical protein
MLASRITVSEFQMTIRGAKNPFDTRQEARRFPDFR